ncbi:hypothetical protein C0Q70_08335 [Pomacea canaliculata]|uniref:MKS transition zone complex subunit 1 n=1 Tax=Pomacea canaliculata TaxID=400727 RepID=A0A2T7PHJ1_POMCA|nr:hypothetical protein C0Q70_08335 [Pomacea canaliculata]
MASSINTLEQLGDELEMAVMNEVALQDHDERTFQWQEKVFSQREVELYGNEQNCFNVLDKKYHEEVTAIIAKGRPTNRLFSYVDHDHYSFQDESVCYLTTSANEKPSKLAQKMARVRCRRVGGRQLKEKNRLEPPPMQVMYIMADLSPKERYDGSKGRMSRHFMKQSTCSPLPMYIPSTVDLTANGVLCMRPDFNRGRKPYVIETTGTGRDVYEYTIEHISMEMNRTEQDKEMKMYREVYSRHREFLNALVGHEFEVPQSDVLRLVVYGEMVSAQGFEMDNIYLHFFVDLPKDWYADRDQQLSWVTQTCATKTVGRDEVAYFSFPFNVELYFKRSATSLTNPDEMLRFPLLLIEVLSIDSWHRFYHEGYTYIHLPANPGSYTITKDCWRPLGKSTVSQLRRFFTGGTPELEDPTYVVAPATFEGHHLSKFGFRTETTGSVTAKINIMMQSRKFMEQRASKRTAGSIVESLGISTMQANITNVLDAFKRARLKMMQAREAASRELLKDIKKQT